MVTIHPYNNGTIIATEGDDVVLTCKATGEELLNYEWIRSSGSLSEIVLDKNGTQLIISDITVDDGGEYYCRVDIGGISLSSMRVNITVESKLSLMYCLPISHFSTRHIANYQFQCCLQCFYKISSSTHAVHIPA